MKESIDSSVELFTNIHAVNEYKEGFSISQVSRWLKISWRRLDYWDRRGIVRPSVVQISVERKRGTGEGRTSPDEWIESLERARELAVSQNMLGSYGSEAGFEMSSSVSIRSLSSSS